jgi:hypothetical protein
MAEFESALVRYKSLLLIGEWIKGWDFVNSNKLNQELLPYEAKWKFEVLKEKIARIENLFGLQEETINTLYFFLSKKSILFAHLSFENPILHNGAVCSITLERLIYSDST